jgi:hypothetical protein
MYFTVLGDIEGVAPGAWFNISVLGDSSYSTKILDTFNAVNQGAQNNLIWSPNTGVQSDFTTPDWLNGYGVMWLSPTIVGGPGKG